MSTSKLGNMIVLKSQTHYCKRQWLEIKRRNYKKCIEFRCVCFLVVNSKPLTVPKSANEGNKTFLRILFDMRVIPSELNKELDMRSSDFDETCRDCLGKGLWKPI